MTNLYLTADAIGMPTGGGAVTYHEAEALKSLGECLVMDRERLSGFADELPGPLLIEADSREALSQELQDPWFWDHLAYRFISRLLTPIKLAHVYAGTFSKTVQLLKSRGTKVTYTAAAHDKDLSRSEHEKLGIPFQYPHLVEPVLWQRYLAGYLAADVLITPSRHSADVMRQYGFRGRLEVIPHGCHLPGSVARLPEHFTVGYLGAIGPDKGLIYLLQAWKQLDYPVEEAELVLAGPQSDSPYVRALLQALGLTEKLRQRRAVVGLLGWVENVSTFYNSISLYIQPSVTEGFGIEVLEACTHGRPVIASTGCGASELLPVLGSHFPPMNPHTLASLINLYKNSPQTVMVRGDVCRRIAEKHTWDRIRQQYIDLWKSL